MSGHSAVGRCSEKLLRTSYVSSSWFGLEASMSPGSPVTQKGCWFKVTDLLSDYITHFVPFGSG